jgi:OOP family OmpA-OmpF porin
LILGEHLYHIPFGVAALLGLQFTDMSLRWSLSVSLLLSIFVFGSATGVAQQSEPPFDSAVDVQLFEYAAGPKSFLTVSSASIAFKDQFSVDFLLTVLTNPFTIYNVNAVGSEVISERTAVVRSMVAGELTAAYGLTSSLQVALALPIVFSIAGDGIDPATAMASADGIQATGFGDFRAEIKARLWRRGELSAAGMAGLTFPTSFGAGGSAFLGDDLPSGRGKFALEWSRGVARAGVNLGVILRKPRDLYASEVGQQLTYGAAGAVAFNERITTVLELFGRTGLGDFAQDISSLEVNGGLRLKAGKSLSVLVGGGSGLGQGIGTPDLRVFTSVGWAPDYRDDDGDGMANLNDRCPLLAEDKDNFEDEDGCPDTDNDGDRRDDAEDACPNEKEDIDGFEDEDGCPEADNDKDGLPDSEDRCPNAAEDGISAGELAKDGCPASEADSDFDEIMDDVDKCLTEAEDMDGFEDWDGCPELDNDSDGIPDSDDQCPLCSEDKDGFEDDDGCPELDNDRDGIADAQDQCPMQAEIINGKNDEDGCPDRGGRRLAYLDGQRLVMTRTLRFDRKDRPTSTSRTMLEQAAVVMKAHPEVTKWLIIAAPSQRRDADAARERGQRWANVIKAYLLMGGVESSRIEALGAAADRTTIAIRIKETAEPDMGDLVCPVNLQAVASEPSVDAAQSTPESQPAPAGDSESDAESDSEL